MILTGKNAEYIEHLGAGKRTKEGLYLNEIEQVHFADKLGLNKNELYNKYKNLPYFSERLRVYSYLRSLGYVIRFSPGYMRIYRRGFRKGEDRTMYLLDVKRPEDSFSYKELIKDIEVAGRIRKDFVVAVVADEITFIKISRTSFE